MASAVVGSLLVFAVCVSSFISLFCKNDKKKRNRSTMGVVHHGVPGPGRGGRGGGGGRGGR